VIDDLKKTLLLLPLVLLTAACASSSPDFGMPETRVLDCDNEVEIRAGFQGPGTQMERIDDRVTTVIDVANNSHREIAVKWIRIEQVMMDSAPYRLENGYRTFNQPIAEGEDHQFEIPMTGRGVRDRSGRSLHSNDLTLAVTVSLESGESYRCQFSVRAPL